MIAIAGLIIVLIGANLFDNAYQSVEPILKSKFTLLTENKILSDMSINSTISTDQLKDHNVLIIHTNPISNSIKLDGIEPNGMTFEKESNNGFLYHIIEKNNQGGNYSIKVSNLGPSTVRVDAIIGEDPFLSKNCDSSYGINCNSVWIAISFVVGGIIAFLVGILLGMFDFRKAKKLQK